MGERERERGMEMSGYEKREASFHPLLAMLINLDIIVRLPGATRGHMTQPTESNRQKTRVCAHTNTTLIKHAHTHTHTHVYSQIKFDNKPTLQVMQTQTHHHASSPK